MGGGYYIKFSSLLYLVIYLQYKKSCPKDTATFAGVLYLNRP